MAGIEPQTLALGGAFTAVIFGLAAQQTLGNLIAGMVLLSARPFRVGERVRLQGGRLAGQIEGTVSSLGLLYTTFATGDDSIMVPNSVVLNVAILPLREPEAVNLRARLRAGMTPGDLQEVLEKSLETPLRDAPRITLEELDGDEVVVRISATPRVAAQGRQLASELLAVVARETRSASAHAVAEEEVRAGAHDAAQLEVRRRLELCAGEDPQSVTGGRLAAGGHGREREQELVEDAVGEQPPREMRASLAQNGVDGEALAHDSRERGRGRRRRRLAPGRTSTWAATGGRLSAEEVSIATRASGSASSGTDASRSRRPETTHARGSCVSPRSTRSSLSLAWRMILP